MKNTNYFEKVQKKIVFIFFISQLFFLISFGSIKELPLSIPFIVSVVLFVFSFLGLLCGKIKINLQKTLFLSIFILTLLLSLIFTSYSKNYTSLFLYVYFFSFTILVNTYASEVEIYKILGFFITICTIFSLYGIYQFIAYNFVDLPLKEIIPKSLWTKGYNTIQSTINLIPGFEIVKAHSIYSEASELSRYSAVSILISFAIKDKISKKKLIFVVVINAISAILSLSGSGIIILCFGLLLFFLYSKSITKMGILFIFILFLFVVINSSSTLLDFFVGRIKELESPNTSGYLRFVLPFKIGFENIKNSFFGYGVGNEDIALELYEATEKGIANGFGKIFVEVGILGLIEYILFFVYLLKNKYKKRDCLFALLWLISLLFNVTANNLSPVSWGFILLLLIYPRSSGRRGGNYGKKNNVIYD